MASLLLVTGPPGAGKSTVAQVLVERFESSVLVSGDAFFSFLRCGAVAPWLTAATEQNHVVTCAAAAATGRYVAGGYTAVYDGIVGPWYLEAFAGPRLALIEHTSNPAPAPADRYASRSGGGRHPTVKRALSDARRRR